MYEKLRDKLSSSEFLQELASNDDAPALRDQEAGAWLFVSDDDVQTKEERDGLGTSEGYVVITQQDIVDGVACFVARSISSLPKSKVQISHMCLMKARSYVHSYTVLYIHEDLPKVST